MIVSSNKVILKNTLMLYFRQVLTVVVSLYTVRIVLDVLGVEDYGIYTVVAGLVTMFTFLKATMSSATQRFFSYALGENDLQKLKKIFSVNLIIYLLIGVISLVLLEILGLWFVNEKLNIPAERFDAAVMIYHLSVYTFFFTIFSTPFTSAIIAHEDMQIYAYLSIVEVLFKLLIVFLLSYLDGDKLVLYGALLLIVSIFTGAIYIYISIRRYKECQIRKFYWDKAMFFEIVGFTGWTMFGQVSSVARNQAVTVLLNQMFNPIIVAASAIAKNISNQLLMFSNNFNSSMYPPIIKSYAINDKKSMFSLIYNGSKITFFLMWVFALPCYIEMEFILGVWLKNIPPNTVIFTQLALIEVLINAVSLPVQTAARAPGKMKNYELILGIIQFGTFLASWFFLSKGSPAESVFIIAIFANLLMFLVRLVIVRNLIGLPLRDFFAKVVIPIAGVVFISAPISVGIKNILPKSILFSMASLAACFMVISMAVYFIGLDKEWRDKARTMILSKIFKSKKL
ncbi:oligosaccharide flippase family protein [Algibacter mikhailovii]|uniref:oligosaccharide flippase family protein n=1 Tax=Algibacter mikhailovii TaxID=425498 RepID=UPI002495107E|nr:oligosaccharide flippase family protein [Algibacter mikhailovii]